MDSGSPAAHAPQDDANRDLVTQRAGSPEMEITSPTRHDDPGLVHGFARASTH
jgi:hypothetical protein